MTTFELDRMHLTERYKVFWKDEVDTFEIAQIEECTVSLGEPENGEPTQLELSYEGEKHVVAEGVSIASLGIIVDRLDAYGVEVHA